jgi:hypothetical protein
LVTIFEAFHKSGHLILDVKPDNIMVATTTTTTMDARQKQLPRTMSPSERLADRIRLVDFGLVKSFRGANGHKENVPSANIQGTPLYASLYQHANETASRRDDLEALLYVIGDLFLTLQGLAQKTQPPYGRGDRASFLPWSQENSDAALGAKKKAMVENKKSVYYQSMPPKVASTLFAATQMVRKYAYSMKPRYDELKQCLAAIELELPAASGSTPAKQRRKSVKDATTTPSAETPTSLRRSPRRPLSMVDDQSLQSIKSSPAAKRTRKVELIEVDEDDDVAMQDADSDEDNRKPAAKRNAKPRGVKRSEEQAMDVEDADTAVAIVAQPRSRKAKGKVVAAAAAATVAANVPSKPSTRLAALIKVTDGKHAGEQHWLANGGSERLVVGSAPTGTGSHMTITGDARIAPNHMTLELNVFEGQGKSVGVKVTDLKSADGILLNGKRIASGKNEMAFCDSASIKIGSHILNVCRE